MATQALVRRVAMVVMGHSVGHLSWSLGRLWWRDCWLGGLGLEKRVEIGHVGGTWTLHFAQAPR